MLCLSENLIYYHLMREFRKNKAIIENYFIELHIEKQQKSHFYHFLIAHSQINDKTSEKVSRKDERCFNQIINNPEGILFCDLLNKFLLYVTIFC